MKTRRRSPTLMRKLRMVAASEKSAKCGAMMARGRRRRKLKPKYEFM